MTTKSSTFLCFLSILTSTFAQKVPTGAVVTNGPECAKIGTSILEKNGTAVEAAIAALFCEGVSVPNCMGLGGGFLMNVYIKETQTSDFLISREVAPINANETMYGGDETLASRGGLAVAVPGELKGYWIAYQKYGKKVPWKDLVQPTIDLCNNGIKVTKYLENIYESFQDLILADPLLKATFFNETSNRTYVENDYIKRPQLAKTLELVAEQGADVLYNGTLTKDFVNDIQAMGGIITEDDLKKYNPIWRPPVKIDLPLNQTLYSSPLPGSGLIVGLIMDILNDFIDVSQPKSVTNWQRIIESFKFGFAKRTELGDPDFVNMSNFTAGISVDDIRSRIFDNATSEDPGYYGANVTQPDDHGTANICVLGPNGDAVAVTSTINLDFGAGFMSRSTGIILNDQMDDFSSPGFDNNYGVPPSPNNYIVPGKRPVSSMSPSIVVDSDGSVRLVVGGSGGTKIITSIVQTIIKNLWFNMTVVEAVGDRRLHHQLFPMELLLESQFEEDQEFISSMRSIGHNVTVAEPSDGFNTVTSISRENGTLRASFDLRRGGGKEFVYSGGKAKWISNYFLPYLVIIFYKFIV